MDNEGLNQYLTEKGYESVVVFENPSYADAFIGISNDDRVIYDYDKMIECLINEDGMTVEDAMEFIDYNTIRAIPYYPNAPIVMYPYDEDICTIFQDNEEIERLLKKKQQLSIDDAFVGTSHNYDLIYDYDKIVNCLGNENIEQCIKEFIDNDSIIIMYPNKEQ